MPSHRAADLATELMEKYRTVLDLIPRLGAHVSTLEIQDGKLLVRGEAPSLEMKHRIWDQIMTVDPLYPDLICEIRVNP
jgi:hypothetical protein